MDDKATQQAFQALAKKDLQMISLEKALKEAHASVAAARDERTKTIEAHQSRIKHLQEKYLQDVKLASQQEVAIAESQLKKKLEADHKLELEVISQKLKDEMQEKLGILGEELKYFKEREKKAVHSLDHEKQAATEKTAALTLELESLKVFFSIF